MSGRDLRMDQNQSKRGRGTANSFTIRGKRAAIKSKILREAILRGGAFSGRMLGILEEPQPEILGARAMAVARFKICAMGHCHRVFVGKRNAVPTIVRGPFHANAALHLEFE